MAINEDSLKLFNSPESKSPLFGPMAGLSSSGAKIIEDNQDQMNLSQRLFNLAKQESTLQSKEEDIQKKEDAAQKISEYKSLTNSDAFLDQLYADSKGNPVLELGARQALLSLTKSAIGNPYLDKFISTETQRLNEDQRAKQALLNQALNYQKALKIQDYQTSRQELKDAEKERQAEIKALYSAVAQGKITTEEAKKVEDSIKSGKSWVQGLGEHGIELKQKQSTQIKKIVDNQTGKEYYHRIIVDPMTGEVQSSVVTDAQGNILTSDIPQYNTFTTRYTVQNIPVREGFGQAASPENLAEYSQYTPGSKSASSSTRTLIPGKTSTNTTTSSAGGFGSIATD